jgi:hypothetical protein
MYDYSWKQQPPDLVNRYPDEDWIRGLAEWRAGAAGFPPPDAIEAKLWADSIRNAPLARRSTHCPRAFVSHRQSDYDWALRIAWIANANLFDYWVDVMDLDPALDPQVKAIEMRLGRSLTTEEYNWLLAAIIEMALLNCTHVIALLTEKARGSRWVPYEYGRVKQPIVASERAASWWDSTTVPTRDLLPEYAHLGPVHRNETEIGLWMQAEALAFPLCASSPRRGWTGGPTIKLPTG